MELIQIVSEDVEIEVPHAQISFVFKQPLEQNYLLALFSALVRVDGVKTPLLAVMEQLEGSKTIFDLFPTPEGSDVIVNPKHIMYIRSPQIGITAMMFPSGHELVVAEGITIVRKKLLEFCPV